MTKLLRLSALLVLAAALMPLNANAQEQKKEQPAKAAPAARAAPVARPAPTARVAPQPQAPQRAAAPQRQAPQRAAAPQHAPQRAVAAQRQAPQRAAAPQRALQRTASPAHGVAPHVVNRQANTPARTATPVVRNATPSAAAPAASVKQTRAQLRSQQAQERTLRQRESQQLRALPASQRAQKQQEINQQRQLRAQQQQNSNAQNSNARVQPNGIVQSNAQAQRASRRNGTARVTPQVARQGRFAAAFANRGAGANGQANQRGLRVAAQQAWSRGQRAGFVSWYGPIFWPYAYSDVFDYAFWPNGYDDGFWAYAYDDFFDGVFWGEQGAPQAYAEVAPQPGPRASNAGVHELCTQPGSGITAWPFAQIQQKVGLSAEQKSQLDEVRSAATKASAVFKTSCPAQNAFPLTPPGRLQAMIVRLQATLEATQTVRPALEAFYNSLSDEQKEHFNELGPMTAKVTTAPATTGQASQASTDAANSCQQPKEGLANLPIEKIEDVVKPTDAQEANLNALQDATTKAVSIMQAACPDETPLTPTGRLEAMQTRLQALIDAASTVKPSLDSFYASLSSEQKARFNRIGQELAQSGG
jgi:LTXXQ motif family protein